MKKLASIFYHLFSYFLLQLAATALQAVRAALPQTLSSRCKAVQAALQRQQPKAQQIMPTALRKAKEMLQAGKRFWLTVNCKLQVKTRRNMKCQKRY